MLPFVRISWSKWIGCVYRMDRKRKVSKVFKINPQGIRLRGDQKTDGIVYKQILRNGKLQIGKRD